MARKLLVIGGAGDMVTVTIRAILEYDDDVELTLVDNNSESLEKRKKEHNNPVNAKFLTGDLFDEKSMSDLIAEADLVLNAAGPYYETALPVLKICMDKGVNYCDLNDEAETTADAIEMHDQAKSSGIGVYLGLGASPGLTNIFAKELIEMLDEPEAVDTVWVIGDEGPGAYGRAVLAHAIHIFGGQGQALSYKNGRITTIPAFTLGEKVSFAQPLGDYMVYELSHPEPITISHYYPQLKQVRNLGGLHPQALNGLFRGLGQGVYKGQLTMDEAIDFIMDVMGGKFGSLKCWKHAWPSMRKQVKSGENSNSAFWKFVWMNLRGKHFDYRGGMVVRAWGMKDGRKVTLVRRTSALGPGTSLASMAESTGLPFAALSRMVLDGKVAPEHQKGVFCPEAWVDVPTFYSYMKRYGIEVKDLMEPIFEE